MKFLRTIFTSMIMLLFICTPAFAQVNFEVNNAQFKPNADFILNNGITYVDPSIIDGILGADVKLEGQNIIILHNNDKLVLTTGSDNATFNGDQIILNAAPYHESGITMLPLRAVMEALGAEISWEESSKKVIINNLETRKDLSVNQVLIKTSQAMDKLLTYSMEGNMQMQMKMSGIEEEGFPIDVDVKSDLFAHYQKEPLTIYTKQVMNMGNIPDVPAELSEMAVESIMTDDAYYINMPEIGWVKMDLGEFNLGDLMQNFNSQDPLLMLKQMNDFGMIANFGNDIIVDGQDYWVLNVMLDQDKFLREYQSIMSQLPIPLDDVKNLLDNMKFDIKYTNLINTSNLMTDYMDMDISMTMSIPSPEENSSEVLDMAIKMQGNFKIMEANPDFKLPDVSSAEELPGLL